MNHDARVVFENQALETKLCFSKNIMDSINLNAVVLNYKHNILVTAYSLCVR